VLFLQVFKLIFKYAKSELSELVEAQRKFEAPHQPPAYAATSSANNTAIATVTTVGNVANSLYPSLNSYMGLDLSVVPVSSQGSHSGTMVIAPVSSQNAVGIMRAEVKPGMRKVTLCKDGNGKVGLVLKDINKGLFVSVVYANTPAALAGLRFGDQILEINGQVMAGYSKDKASSFLKKCRPEKIEVVVRDRPFERAITLNKDSNGYVGFCFKKGKIVSIVKDSSAARNGLLIDHQLVEVDGRNVVGMTDKEIQAVVDSSPRTVTVTIMPTVLYDHMVKCIGSSELRKYMDHSIPEL
jgi:syntenin-1